MHLSNTESTFEEPNSGFLTVAGTGLAGRGGAGGLVE